MLQPGHLADGQAAGERFKTQSAGLQVLAQPSEEGSRQTLCAVTLSTMWLKLISVVAEFCFSPFLVADQETSDQETSDAPEQSSLSSQALQQPTSTGKCQSH